MNTRTVGLNPSTPSLSSFTKVASCSPASDSTAMIPPVGGRSSPTPHAPSARARPGATSPSCRAGRSRTRVDRGTGVALDDERGHAQVAEQQWHSSAQLGFRRQSAPVSPPASSVPPRGVRSAGPTVCRIAPPPSHPVVSAQGWHTSVMNDTTASDPVLAAAAATGVPFEVVACDPDLADTAAFCEAYGYRLDQSANAIIVVGKSEPRSTRRVSCSPRPAST